MAKPLRLTMACAPYDRVQPLFDGRVRIEGCELECHPILPDRAFAIANSTQQFDISEISGGTQQSTSGRIAASPSRPTCAEKPSAFPNMK